MPQQTYGIGAELALSDLNEIEVVASIANPVASITVEAPTGVEVSAFGNLVEYAGPEDTQIGVSAFGNLVEYSGNIGTVYAYAIGLLVEYHTLDRRGRSPNMGDKVLPGLRARMGSTTRPLPGMFRQRRSFQPMDTLFAIQDVIGTSGFFYYDAEAEDTVVTTTLGGTVRVVSWAPLNAASPLFEPTSVDPDEAPFYGFAEGRRAVLSAPEGGDTHSLRAPNAALELTPGQASVMVVAVANNLSPDSTFLVSDAVTFSDGHTLEARQSDVRVQHGPGASYLADRSGATADRYRLLVGVRYSGSNVFVRCNNRVVGPEAGDYFVSTSGHTYLLRLAPSATKPSPGRSVVHAYLHIMKATTPAQDDALASILMRRWGV